MKKNYLYLLLAFVILVLVTLLFFVFNKNSNNIVNNSKKTNNQKLAKNSNKNTSTVIYSKKKEIKENQKLDIPSKYDKCKEKPFITNCILNFDQNKQKVDENIVYNEDKMIKKLDDISSFKDELKEKQKNLKNEISNNIEDKYINSNIRFIYKDTECKTDFCRGIVVSIKKGLVDSMNSLGALTKASSCKNIPEKDVKTYCMDLIE